MRKTTALIVTLFISMLTQAQGFKPSEVVTFKEIEGKDDLVLNFFLPTDFKKNDGQKRAAVVFFFGGGWSGGSPKQFFSFADHLAKKVWLRFLHNTAQKKATVSSLLNV